MGLHHRPQLRQATAAIRPLAAAAAAIGSAHRRPAVPPGQAIAHVAFPEGVAEADIHGSLLNSSPARERIVLLLFNGIENHSQ